VEETDADGNVTTVTKSVLYVNVTLKSYRDMISVYGFNSDQIEMLEQIMSPEFMGQLGYAGSGSGGGGGSPGVSSMTEDEINAILSGITDSRQKAVCSYALHRVGYPYSQELRDSGNYYDCSSLAYYSWKDAGVNISHGGATTAAAEAQGLDEAGKTVSYDEMQPGDLIFYSFTNNGRYKNISHVAVYVGNGKREYGTPEKIKDVYDYRAKLKQKFYFYQDLSKDDDIPKNMQNDFLHQMYKEFGTIEEEYFYDRLEDGKYDEGFKERQVKEKKSR